MFDQSDDEEEPLEILTINDPESKFLPTFSDSIDNALGKKRFCTNLKNFPYLLES